ncbi:hypothetical protein BIW11_03366 [Tropilaelaps mercedesae]|uniref:Uncharacterized protein n=1 Tax=Tropilaelaps mercedesae TaxID=418985 RepID=A0A1V9XMX1_9ACAR|nr:hypothetical protein BIW11_03366 [Tropilaelaps mercedesae]
MLRSNNKLCKLELVKKQQLQVPGCCFQIDIKLIRVSTVYLAAESLFTGVAAAVPRDKAGRLLPIWQTPIDTLANDDWYSKWSMNKYGSISKNYDGKIMSFDEGSRGVPHKLDSLGNFVSAANNLTRVWHEREPSTASSLRRSGAFLVKPRTGIRRSKADTSARADLGVRARIKSLWRMRVLSR